MKDNAKTNTQAEAMTPAESKTFELVQNHNNDFAVLAEGEGAAVRISTATDDVTLFNAVNGSGESVADNLDKEVEVNNIVVTSVDVHTDPNDDDSPVVNKCCVNFFATDGRMISSISNGIIRSTKSLFNVGFQPTIEHPITIKFKSTKTKRGIAHTFDLVKR